ncbi:hypothetical protein Tco_0040033 [Tanacetum coccineum]
MSTSNQQTLVESGASDRPPMLEKGSYVPWASRFLMFLDNKQEDGERMQRSINIGPYERKMIPNPDKSNDQNAEIIEPLSKVTEANKKQYYADIKEVDYDQLFDTLSQYKPHVNASKAKKATRNHDLLALVAHSNVRSLHSYASPSYSHSPQPYYVTHPSSIIDYEEDYQGKIQRDAQEDKFTTAMMLLAREITQHGRIDIQIKNVGYAGNGNWNAGTQYRNQIATAGNGMVQQIDANDQIIQRVLRTESNPRKTNVQCYNCNAKGHCVHDRPQPKVCDLNAAVILMAHIQPTNDEDDVESTYYDEALSEVNVSQIYLKSGMLSKGVHEHTNHEKLKNAINTSDDDQIDSSIIFDDPYVENNGGTDEHDLNAHDQSFDIESLIYNVQKEAKNQQRMNNELVKQKAMLQKELETCKERLKALEKKPVQSLNYKEACEDLERELSVEKDTIEKLEKEKDKIQGEFFQLENENKNSILMIKFFTKWDNRFKQFICLGKPNKVYDPFLKDGLGYQNPKRLKKAIITQPKMYDGERFQSNKVIIDSPDSEKTLEDVEESRLKMKDKMIQLDYEKLNALYETFVPQKKIPIEQTYFLTPSTSNIFNSIKATRVQHQHEINELIENVTQNTYAYGDVRAKNQDLLMIISELKDKLKLAKKAKIVNTKFVKSASLKKLVCVTPLNKNKDLKAKTVSKAEIKTYKSKPITSCSTSKNEQTQKTNANVITRGMYGVTKTETKMPVAKTNKFSCNSTSVASSSSVRKSESMDTNLNKRVLLNTKSKSTSKDVMKSQTKTVNVVLDGLNLICVSYGKYVFLISHDKCFASYALSPNSRVKRDLFASPVAAKSSKLRATPVVAKSRFSVATPPKTTNKMIQIVLWIVDSGCSKHMTGYLKLLRNFVEKFMGTVRFGNDNFTAITGYGDYGQGNLTICHVCYVEGLRHNIFSVGQFCDGDLEVAFHSNTCYV